MRNETTTQGDKEMTATEIIREVLEQLSPDAMQYWNGATQELVDEIAVVGQRDGIVAAIDYAEAMAADPQNDGRHGDEFDAEAGRDVTAELAYIRSGRY